MNNNLSIKENNIAILLCAGKSERVNDFDKSIVNFNDKPIFFYSIEKLLSSKKINNIVIVASKENNEFIKNYLSGLNLKNIEVILGSTERKYSVKNALTHISKYNPNNVIIHDSARPYFNNEIILNGLKFLDNYACVIPVVKIVDTVKKINADKVLSTIERDNLYYSQTPQFFNYDKLKNIVLEQIYNKSYTDEAQLFEENNFDVAKIDGNLSNHKITFKNDLDQLQEMYQELVFTGISSDVHELAPGESLYLGGVHIPFKKGLLGHSDGDVVIHAICDAILGANSKGDLGKYFPSSDIKWKKASSKIFLDETLKMLEKEKKEIKNIDIQIILQEPKLFEYLHIIEENISKLLKLNIKNINVKVTSTDGLGLIGSGDGIATLCAVNLIKK